jgi:hypothetical protein
VCTLTVIQTPNDPAHSESTIERIAFNRDELLTRAPGLPPRAVDSAGVTAVMPLDPDAGGAWIACTSLGLVLALLNRTNPSDRQPPPDQQTSRGLIIPSLVASTSVTSALASLYDRFDAEGNPTVRPFTLWMSDGRSHAIVRHTGRSLTCRLCLTPSRWLILSSSSLGDDRVRAARAAAFRLSLATNTSSVRAQDAFHNTFASPPDPIGPLVRRADARTLSQTVIVRRHDQLTLHHRDLPARTDQPDLGVPFSSHTIAISRPRTLADRHSTVPASPGQR